MKTDYERLKRQWAEDQRTLEELGLQLSINKLQISEFKERAVAQENAKNGQADPWTPDKMSSSCKKCNKEFSMTRRRVDFSKIFKTYKIY